MFRGTPCILIQISTTRNSFDLLLQSYCKLNTNKSWKDDIQCPFCLERRHLVSYLFYSLPEILVHFLPDVPGFLEHGLLDLVKVLPVLHKVRVLEEHVPDCGGNPFGNTYDVLAFRHPSKLVIITRAGCLHISFRSFHVLARGPSTELFVPFSNCSIPVPFRFLWFHL